MLLDKYVSRSADAAWREIDGEAQVIVPRESELHSLNEVGTAIWKYADGSRKVSEIVNAIMDDFDVEKSVAEQDTLNFIQALVDMELAQVSDNPIPQE